MLIAAHGMPTMITLLHEQSEKMCSTGRARGDDLWIGAQEFAAATGWLPKPEGLCRGEICMPVPSGRAAEYISDHALNAAAWWRWVGHPVVHDAAGEALGARHPCSRSHVGIDIARGAGLHASRSGGDAGDPFGASRQKGPACHLGLLVRLQS